MFGKIVSIDGLSDFAALQALEADATPGGWYLPASVGAIAGGFLMHYWMNRGPRASGMLSGIERRCVRYGRNRHGRKVCRRFRAA